MGLQKREHRHKQGFSNFLIAKVKTREKSWVWWEHEFAGLRVKSVSVLVPIWFGTTNQRRLLEAVPSPGSGQMGLWEGLTREVSALLPPVT